ncbi:MAG: hypothetical protein CMI26_05350 [Opitutae bacterium]|nr:hypothetical protein [Opitutae bacterium]
MLHHRQEAEEEKNEGVMETVVVDVMETDVVGVMETGVVDVMETDAVDVMETDAVGVMETDAVGVMEVTEGATRVATEIQNVDLSEKISVIKTVRQWMNKKSPTGRGTDLVDGRATGAEIATARVKKAQVAMESKVLAKIARTAEIPNPTKTLPPLARRPMRPLIKSLAVLVNFWLVYSEANRLVKINP